MAASVISAAAAASSSRRATRTITIIITGIMADAVGFIAVLQLQAARTGGTATVAASTIATKKRNYRHRSPGVPTPGLFFPARPARFFPNPTVSVAFPIVTNKTRRALVEPRITLNVCCAWARFKEYRSSCAERQSTSASRL